MDQHTFEAPNRNGVPTFGLAWLPGQIRTGGWTDLIGVCKWEGYRVLLADQQSLCLTSPRYFFRNPKNIPTAPAPVDGR